MSTPAVDRAYYAAMRAEDRYTAALDKAGISRWSGKKTPAVTRAYKAKVAADLRYHKAVEKMRERANPMAKKNPRRSVRLLKKTLKRMGRSRAQRSETLRGLKRITRKRNPGSGSLNLNPLRKVMKEAGTKKVRVMRSKSGKPVGVKFL